MNKTWECRICRSTELQVEEHPFCPNCSHEHDWEDEVEAFFLMDDAPDHRFHGNTFTCCDRGWSARARYCGCCGSKLEAPATQVPEPEVTPAPNPSALRPEEAPSLAPPPPQVERSLVPPTLDAPRSIPRAPTPPSVVPWTEPERRNDAANRDATPSFPPLPAAELAACGTTAKPAPSRDQPGGNPSVQNQPSPLAQAWSQAQRLLTFPWSR